MTTAAPELSVVIPVYNEERILAEAVRDLHARLLVIGRSFEIIIAENGSRDRTVELARALSAELPGVSTFSASLPDYGEALREGIERARGRYEIGRASCRERVLCVV